MAVDVAEADFQSQVIEASSETPVVVDFWAGWCQPCLVLAPVLERIARDLQGRVSLVKVDVDANPGLAATFRIQGIPAVKAFRDGVVVSEFVGVQPEQVVRSFFEALAPDRAALDAAVEALERGDTSEAEALLRRRLTEKAGDAEAAAILAEILLSRDEIEEASRLIAPFPRGGAVSPVAAKLDLHRWALEEGDLGTAAADVLAGDEREALERCLKLISSGVEADRARALALAVFALRGDEDPLTREYRRRLTALLF